MENYIIKAGATAEYILLENSSKETAKFVAEMEWKKIFIHNIEEDQIWCSQYEKTTRYKIPANLVEEYIEEILEEEIIENKQYIKKEYIPYIAFWIITIIFMIIWINNQFTKSNIQETKKTPIIEEKTLLQTYTDRLILLENKKDFELQKQKKLREEINKSIEIVKTLEKEKEEIAKQKIEISQ